MRRSTPAVAAGAVLVALAGLLAPAARAQGATTYTIQAFQDFFPLGIPGFSARIYPGEVTVHRGDTIHFTEGLALFPDGAYPQDFTAEGVWEIGGPYSFFQPDPDDGANGIKLAEDRPGTCGLQDDPCVWDGSGDELIFGEHPPEGDGPPDFSMWVTIDAPPGTTLWAGSVPGSDPNLNIAVNVVGPNEATSTQAELDARAAALMEKDYEDAAALHARMNAKRTSHLDARGHKVFDVWVGAVGGPVELFASYPRRITVPRGARVQYHFQDAVEAHTATFGGRRARALFRNGIAAVCDPDGDGGTSPDTPAVDAEPPCTPPAALELDVDRRLVDEVGDGRVSGENDLENSGLKTPHFPEETSFDANPWTVRMSERSDGKGFRYICLVHGGFMGGLVAVE